VLVVLVLFQEWEMVVEEEGYGFGYGYGPQCFSYYIPENKLNKRRVAVVSYLSSPRISFREPRELKA